MSEPGARGALAGRDVLVEGLGPGAVEVARLLALEGARVRIAGPGPPPPGASQLAELGVLVEAGADLDAEPGAAEVAFVDVWTPETAPRVRALRARGAVLASLADLVLARARVPVVGVTGSAGKTTGARALVTLLRQTDGGACCAAGGPSANLWPDGELVARVDAIDPPARLVLELTSSHLAFAHSSPQVAVVTCFWPDHLELHGSLASYRRAKEAVVRHQREGDWVVLPYGDAATAPFGQLTPARRVWFGRYPPDDDGAEGVFVRGERVAARWEGRKTELCDVSDLPLPGPGARSVLAACAAALAAGAKPEHITGALPRIEPVPHRLQTLARIRGTEVIDDGMAATPAKAAAALEALPDGSLVWIAGGRAESEGGPVHASREEHELLEAACALGARKARTIVLFGEAGARLARRLPRAELLEGLDDAVARALACAGGAEAVLFAPMYPLRPAERDRFVELVGDASRRRERDTLR